MSKLIGNQEFNGDVYVKGIGGYDGTNASGSGVLALDEAFPVPLTTAEIDTLWTNAS